MDAVLLEKSSDALGSKLPWLKSLRSKAAARFTELGFPTIKQEAWRFTPVDPIAQGTFQFVEKIPAMDKSRLAALSLAQAGEAQLVFVDGNFEPALSTVPRGASFRAGPLSSFFETNSKDLEGNLGRWADADRSPFTALNTALFREGAYVYLTYNTV